MSVCCYVIKGVMIVEATKILQGIRLLEDDYCTQCVKKNIDDELSHIKDQLNALIAANNVGVAVKKDNYLPSD